MSEPKDKLENETELERVERLTTILDERTGITEFDIERVKFINSYSRQPDISAQEALDRILGDTTYIDGEITDEFKFSENDYIEDRELNYSNAVRRNEPSEIIQERKNELEKAKEYIKQRSNIASLFFSEIVAVRAQKSNKNLLLRITQDNPIKPIECVRLSKGSVANWAKKHADINIPEWNEQRTKSKQTHTTELLEVMEEVIEEFWENRDKNEDPVKKAAVDAWMQEKFPDMVKKGEPLSTKIRDAIYTITRPTD